MDSIQDYVQDLQDRERATRIAWSRQLRGTVIDPYTLRTKSLEQLEAEALIEIRANRIEDQTHKAAEAEYAKAFGRGIAKAGKPGVSLAAAPASATTKSKPRDTPAWLDNNIDYLAQVCHEKKCASAKALFNALAKQSTHETPVQKGSGHGHDKLFFPNASAAIADNTFRKYWPKIKARAALALNDRDAPQNI